MATFEVKLADKSRHLWEGKDGLEACQRYADAHPGVTVVALASVSQTRAVHRDARRD